MNCKDKRFYIDQLKRRIEITANATQYEYGSPSALIAMSTAIQTLINLENVLTTADPEEKKSSGQNDLG